MDLYRAPRSQVIHQAREISPLAFSLPEGYLQGVQGQVGAHWPVGGLPPDDSPGVHVGHESHVDPPGERTHVGGGTSRLRGGGMAATHSSFGLNALQYLLTRSAGHRSRGALRVVRGDLARLTPCMPKTPMSRSTVQRTT